MDTLCQKIFKNKKEFEDCIKDKKMFKFIKQSESMNSILEKWSELNNILLTTSYEKHQIQKNPELLETKRYVFCPDKIKNWLGKNDIPKECYILPYTLNKILNIANERGLL